MSTRDEPWPDGYPCWADLMTADVPAAREFYGALFGWEFDVGGPETNNYSTATLGGRRVAGIFSLAMDHPPVWSTYLATGDADATQDAVVRAGGAIAQPTMDVMDFGRMGVLQDPSNGTFGSWQPGTQYGAQLVNTTGAMVWNELLSRDYDTAKEFYAAVFSYSFTEIGSEGFRYSTIEVDGRTVGGIGAMPEFVPEHVPSHWRVYFEVDDVDATVAAALGAGGAVLREAMDTPFGRMADLADPQGAAFSIIASSGSDD